MKTIKYLSAFLAGALLLSGCTSKPNAQKETVTFQHDQAIVDVEGGKLRGYIDNGIYTFKGIQYATAKRFEEPQKIAKWEGIKDAQVYGDMCPQQDMTAGAAEMINPHLFWPEATDETKIQTLNVWTKDLNKDKKKPVMVLLHVGVFSTGAFTEQISYDGRNLSERGDVVVVSINHRLNALGYLDLSAYGEQYKHSGNLGQMDIVASLQWVHDNIEQFGGDPNNVTIFGQSGGGRKVLNLMGTPSAKGLFHKAIVQSGSRQSNTQEEAQLVAKLTLKNLGISENEVSKIETVSHDLLLDAGNKAIEEAKTILNSPSINWSPVVDGDFMPKDIWLDGNLNDESKDIPLLIGTVFSEFSTNAFSYAGGAPMNKAALTDDEAKAILTDKFGDKTDAAVEAFKKAFPDKKDVDAAFYDVNAYRLGVLDVANKKANQGGAKVYNYMFALEIPTMGGWTPWHCSDLPFVFHNIELVKATFSLEDKVLNMQDMMCDAWINFAKTGDPNHKGMIEWPNYTSKDGSCMIFDEKSVIGQHFDKDFIELVTQK